ncbi:hypothetical protein D7B24_000376 [Verticillium nonalfalfae]|uniref:Nitrogen regulatory protein areA GATA-like domain-containing protein n=1 Tax=Verticillium nonalfalfae TaxID=1051616 RepID=A0A3M9Y216_9PEZI|nr:uncharacterized protein D7B24_000376 [Verticillium nonalfalfae]RNJ54533.1 hypothetical protein D7B24_000376 [Verticillium nonalfalfae]
MDLPKGFVEDDKRIYGKVANLNHLSLDVIRQFWQVYTTTNKQLYDPTARRLENFWWHVWGSDRRHLKAEVLADIWQQISSGPTFVPLKGSPNRYEPPIDEPKTVVPMKSSQSTNLLLNVPSNPPSDLQDILADALPAHVPEPSRNGEPASVKELSASSSRPPPPHPILKKSRGDSKSGPRPTARFVSPPSSDEDECKSSEEVSSSSTATSGLDMRASSNAAASSEKSSKKKAATPTKRFVASSTASKRRPLLARRQSSQSSAGSSEPHPKAGSSAGSRFSGSQQGSVTSNPDRASAQTTPDSHPNDTMLSAKAFGKKPAVQPNPAVTVANQNHRHHQTQSAASQPLPKPTQALLGGPRPRMPDDLHGSPRKDGFSTVHSGQTNVYRGPTSAPRSSLPASANEHRGPMSSSMERSSSNSERHRPRQTSIGRTASYGLLSNATAVTSNIAANGQLSRIADEPDIVALQAIGALNHDISSPYLARNPSTTSLLMPTIPSSAPSVPLARSRSQLTLLLEREKARSDDKGRPKPRSKS